MTQTDFQKAFEHIDNGQPEKAREIFDRYACISSGDGQNCKKPDESDIRKNDAVQTMRNYLTGIGNKTEADFQYAKKFLLEN